jgi:hypothetical protein
MLQLPLSLFRPRRRRISQRAFFQSFRSVLAIGLAGLLFLAPLSLRVSAQGQMDTPPEPKLTKTHQFTIYQDENGNAVCREATLAERIQNENINTSNLGLHQINHLKPVYDDYAHSSNNQTGGTNVGTGLTINLISTTQLDQPANAAAKAAFIRAAQNWENIIMSPVTIYIKVDYGSTNFGQPWPSGVIGSTGTPSHSYPYQSVRTNMLAEAGGEGNTTKQTVFNSLPSTSVPTDLGNASGTDVIDANARALGLLNPTAQPTDPAAQIAFNSAFNYDFDPSDGITPGQTDFDAVATHEIGHALGLDSDAGEGLSRPAVWDLYRFRTGTTVGGFTSAQRLMTIGGSPDPLQFFFYPDGVNTQQGLSTGGPDGKSTNGGDGWQSSHWKHMSGCDNNGGNYIGIMDPAISSGCRRSITATDKLALDSFGYNRLNNVTPPPPPPPPAAPANDNFANAQIITGCSGSVTGTNISATKETGEPNNPASPTSTKSVWYQWTAPSTGSVTIDTHGSEFDTILTIYTGNSLSGLSQVTFNDDTTSGSDVTSTVTFNATQGTVYRINVNGYDNSGDGGDTGSIKLNWSASNCTQASPTIQLSASSYSFGEAVGQAQITVTRTGDTSAAATVNYATSDTAGLTPCNTLNTGAASSRCDYATTTGTLQFAAGDSSKTIFIPVVDDAYAEGNETLTITLSNAQGATLGTPSSATITIVDNDATTGANPIDNTAFFVNQHYIDFLERVPDAQYQVWQNILNTCPPSGKDSNGNFCDRIEVSADFFRSEEFQSRGYFIYRFYKVLPSISDPNNPQNGHIPHYSEFAPDLARVSGVLSAQQLEANKVAFINDFMARTEFQNTYGSITDPTSYVNALLQTVGLTNHPTKQTWINDLTSANNATTRAQVLRELIESSEMSQKYFNEAFVIMQYFGYLRRDADASYASWITTMNSTNGDYRTMVNGFLNSAEYRQRFGP